MIRSGAYDSSEYMFNCIQAYGGVFANHAESVLIHLKGWIVVQRTKHLNQQNSTSLALPLIYFMPFLSSSSVLQ